MDRFQEGHILSGCGGFALWCLHIIGSILGLILVGVALVLGWISDLLFGES